MVETDPRKPEFGLETDPRSPDYGLPVDVPSPSEGPVSVGKRYAPSFDQGPLIRELLRQTQPDLPLPEDTQQEADFTQPPPEEETLSDRIKKFLFEPEGAQVTREAIQDAVMSVPEMAKQIPEQLYQAMKFKVGTPQQQNEAILELARQGIGTGQQTAHDIQQPFGTKQFLRGAGQMGMMAAPGFELLRELRTPPAVPRGPAVPGAPPVQPAPPPIPPEYAQRQFTAPGIESGWQMGPNGELVPVGQPEAPPQTAPAPGIPETLQQIPSTPDVRAVPQSMALGPANPNFVMRPGAPETAPAPSIEETLQKAQPPPVDPNLATHERTRAVLDNRKQILNKIEQLRPLVENARALTGGRGERALEAEWADLQGQLNNKETNPVVHAPPAERTVPSESAVVPRYEAPIGPPMEQPAPSSEVRTNIRSEHAELPQEARFPRGGPASEPGGTQGASEAPGRVRTAEPSEEAAKYGGPAAAREALRQQVRRDQAARIKRKIQKDGGFVSKVTMEDIRNLGKDIYEWGMDFHQWASEMLAHLGKTVAGHLQDIWAGIQATAPYRAWEEITGGPLRKPFDLSKPENFELVDQVVPLDVTRPTERGSVGRTGGRTMTSVDSNGDRHTGEWDPNLSAVPKLLATAPKEEANLYRTKNILGTKADPKTVKGEKYGVSTYISYLAAEKGSKVVNMCVFATDKCVEGCLGKGGNAKYSTVVNGRINKTKYFAYDPVTYFRQLDGEIVKAKAKAEKAGNVLAIRLNGTSDVLWEKSGILERHPDVQFYDYTKYPQTLRKNLPPNYHLTYSYTGTPASDSFSNTWYDHGINTAVVFRDGMPAKFLGRDVIDGDVSDLRFLDPDGVVVGLHAKGKLLLRDKATGKYIETNEFVYDTPPNEVAIPYFSPPQKAQILKGEFLGEEALGAMKDLAPKAGDLKYVRGNPDLGFNQPGATPQLTPIQAFRERLQARRAAIRAEGRQLSALGFDPEDTALQAAIGGTYIAEGVTDFAKWSAAMVKEFGPDIEPHLTNLWKSANAAHQQFQQTGQYTSAPQTPSTQAAPIGVRNETLRAREDAGLSTAPPPGIGTSWHDSVKRGNAALDAGADPYKIISDFNRDSLIGHPRMDPARAWLERLQRANSEAHGALEADPQNPTLAAEALRTQAVEDEFTAAFQPMKTEWARTGHGMQEERGITDSDLLSQKTAEQTMRDSLDRELNASDKARAADAVKRTRKANADTEAAFTEALDHAEKAAKAPPMTPEQMKEHFAKRYKDLLPC